MKKMADKLFHHHHTSGDNTEKHSYHRKGSERVEGHSSHVTRDSSGMLVHQKVASPVEETVVRPPIVEQTVRKDEVIEVQPIIHRFVEVPEVRHIEKHVFEKVAPGGPQIIYKEPIVDVTVQPCIIEEVQTIVHREVPEVQVVHEQKHIFEHTVRPTIYTNEVLGQQTVTSAPHVLPLEATTSSPKLRSLAEPHEKIPKPKTLYHPIDSKTTTTTWSAAQPQLAPTTKWVYAYPKAMHRERKESDNNTSHLIEKTDSKKESVEKRDAEKRNKKIDVEKGVGESAEKKNDERCEKINDNECDKSDDENKAGKREEKEAVTIKLPEVKQELIDVNSATGGPTFDHPVFVERPIEHTSLDVRANLSLERLADLQAFSGELPAFTAVPNIHIDRYDLERGSQIGLEETSPIDEQHTKTSPSSKPKSKSTTTTNTTTPSSSSSNKTKLEEELRKKNNLQAGGTAAALVKLQKHDNATAF